MHNSNEKFALVFVIVICVELKISRPLMMSLVGRSKQWYRDNDEICVQTCGTRLWVVHDVGGRVWINEQKGVSFRIFTHLLTSETVCEICRRILRLNIC